jgi:hypothetical protein
MAARRRLSALLLAAALAGCAELTAEAPLFSPADQVGPPPLTEGVWIAVHEECPAHYARRRSGRFHAECTPIEIRRQEDGAWVAHLRVDLVFGLTAQQRADAEEYDPVRVIIAPAVERPPADGYSPLYVAELSPTEQDDDIGYAVIAPIGAMPATSMLLVGSIGCVDILRDGPIDGITAQYAPVEGRAGVGEPGVGQGPGGAPESGPGDAVGQPMLSGCVASSQAAVREAARRAVIENLDEMLERRYVYVRPN